MNQYEGPPPAKSARIKPKKRALLVAGAPSASKSSVGDPRFDPIYGPVDKQLFERNYKFLRVEQVKEEQERRGRIKRLKCFLRRVELEKSGENLDEYDLSDTENEVFGEEHRMELSVLRRTSPIEIYKELSKLQRESQIYISQTKDSEVHDRRKKLETTRVKEEVKAVKEGKKSKPFFPKRREIKQQILSDTFERLEKAGGKAAIEKYVVRKQKRVR